MFSYFNGKNAMARNLIVFVQNMGPGPKMLTYLLDFAQLYNTDKIKLNLSY